MRNMRYLAVAAAIVIILGLALSESQAVAGSTDLLFPPTIRPYRDWPVTMGVPLAEGELSNPNHVWLVPLTNQVEGDPIPVQGTALSYWDASGGSIRWLLVDFQTTTPGRRTAGKYRLYYGSPPPTSPPADSLQTESWDDNQDGFADRVRVTTGPLRFLISREGFRLFDRVWLDLDSSGTYTAEELVVIPSDDSGAFAVVNGVECATSTSSVRTLEVEESGPYRTVIHLDGAFADTGGATELEFEARITAYAGKPFVKVEFTFVNMSTDWMTLDSVDLRLNINSGLITTQNREIVQDSHDHYSSTEGDGLHYRGYIDLNTTNYTVAAGMRDFWQRYPSGLRSVGAMLELQALPSGTPHQNWRSGRASTRETCFLFYPLGQDKREYRRALERPPMAMMDRYYLDATSALGPVAPVGLPAFQPYDELWSKVGGVMSGFRSDLVNNPDEYYGLDNYGDWFFEHELDNAGNLEYDTVHSMLTQYLRGNNYHAFHHASTAVKHWMDIDMVRTTAVLGAKWVGLPYVHGIDHSIAPNTGHIWNQGCAEYFYLTGHRRAEETVLTIADAVADRICPGAGCDIASTWRGAGWPLLALLTGYEMTWDSRYLASAEHVIDRLWLLRDPVDGVWWEQETDYSWCQTWLGGVLSYPLMGWKEHLDSTRVQQVETMIVDMTNFYKNIAWDPLEHKSYTTMGKLPSGEYFSDNRSFPNSSSLYEGGHHYGGHISLMNPQLSLYSYELTGDSEYLDFMLEVFVYGMDQVSVHDGKSRTQATRFVPHYLGKLMRVSPESLATLEDEYLPATGKSQPEKDKGYVPMEYGHEEHH